MPSQAQLKIGEIIDGSYRVLSKIADGGMGSVYKVEHVNLHHMRALKTLADKGEIQQEALNISKLTHKSIIQVYDFGVTEYGAAYYVMDLVEGKTLQELMRQQGQLDIQEALAIFKDVAEGLAYAHSRQLVHRDIKPSNIMLEISNDDKKSKTVKIIDFGLAEKSGRSNVAAREIAARGGDFQPYGSPPYMSPEQFQEGIIDFRSDVYSFGCTLFEALTGVPPFISDSALVLSMKHLSELPPTLKQASMGRDFPADLEMIQARLLAKHRQDRYQDMRVVAEDLQGVLESLPQGQASKSISAPLAAQRFAADNKGSPGETLGDSQSITTTPLPQARLAKYTLWTCGVLLMATCAALTIALTHSEKTKEPQAQAAADRSAGPWTKGQKSQPPSNPDMGNTSDNIEPLKTPFSTIVIDAAGKKMRVFDFPTGVRLGRLVDRAIPNHAGWAAQGRVSVPADHELQFNPSAACCESPSYFRRFRPEDLCEINLTQDDAVTSEALNYLDHLKLLTKLSLHETETDNECLPIIDQFPKLDWLDVSNTNMTGDGLAKLKCLRQLHAIRFSQLLNVSPLIAALKDSPNLTDMHADATQLTREDLKTIAALPNLKLLAISQTKMGLPGLEILSHAPSLQNLTILNSSFGPECIPVLKNFRALRRVKLSCTTWTQAQINLIKNQLPAVTVEAEKIEF